MPRNTIEQLDKTSSVQDIVPSNTVFIPIETTAPIDPVLITTLSDLKDKFESSLVVASALEYSLKLGYNLAKHLISIGLTVLVQGVTSAMTDGQWEDLEDRNLYDIRFLTNGAMKAGVVQAMLTCAKNRGDCTALVNFDESADGFDYSVETIQGLVSNITGGEFGSALTPAFYTLNSDFTQKDEVLIPAAFGHLFAYAQSIKTNPEWFAVAGFDRGVIPELSRVAHKFSTAEVNELQKRDDTDPTEDNVGIAINAIAYIRPAGYIIYGNRTLKNNTAAKKLTATSFLNVRNMISVVSKVAYEAANKFTFEQNSEALWVNYKSYIQPTLERIVHSNGALGYSINKIKTNVKATLKAEIIIQPIEAVEDIELTIVMTDANTVVAEQ